MKTAAKKVYEETKKAKWGDGTGPINLIEKNIRYHGTTYYHTNVPLHSFWVHPPGAPIPWTYFKVDTYDEESFCTSSLLVEGSNFYSREEGVKHYLCQGHIDEKLAAVKAAAEKAASDKAAAEKAASDKAAAEKAASDKAAAEKAASDKAAAEKAASGKAAADKAAADKLVEEAKAAEERRASEAKAAEERRASEAKALEEKRIADVKAAEK